MATHGCKGHRKTHALVIQIFGRAPVFLACVMSLATTEGVKGFSVTAFHLRLYSSAVTMSARSCAVLSPRTDRGQGVHPNQRSPFGRTAAPPRSHPGVVLAGGNHEVIIL